jgi:hypothetical protein
MISIKMMRLLCFLFVLFIKSVLSADHTVPHNPYVFTNAYINNDWRAFENGSPITVVGGKNLPEKYDYQEGLNTFELSDDVWVRTLTVARKGEGNPSQHIIAQRSLDGGRTWEPWYDLEPEGPPHTSYGGFHQHPKTGRVYFMYMFGPDEHPLKFANGEPFRGHYHHVAKTAFRTVHKDGTFSERHFLDIPKTAIDHQNPFEGKYTMIYGTPAPSVLIGDDGFGFYSKVGPKPIVDFSEAFIVKYNNYAQNDDIKTLDLELLPPGEHGVQAPGSECACGFSPFRIDGQDMYFKFRTTGGYAGYAETHNGGQSFFSDFMRYSPNGRYIKNPEGPFRVVEDEQERLWLVFYNNSQKRFGGRDLVFISYMEFRDQKLYVTEPELFHYRKDQLGSEQVRQRLNCPGFSITSDGVKGKSSDKLSIQTFTMLADFLNILSRQFDLKAKPETGLLIRKDNPGSQITAPKLPALNKNGGFTLVFDLKADQLRERDVLIDGYRDRQGIKISVSADNTLLFSMSDGNHMVELTSNQNVLTPGKSHQIAIIVDGYPDLVSMIVDGKVQDGGKEKLRGTVWFDHAFTHTNNANTWQIAQKKISNLHVYNRFLLTTEVIGLQRTLN